MRTVAKLTCSISLIGLEYHTSAEALEQTNSKTNAANLRFAQQRRSVIRLRHVCRTLHAYSFSFEVEVQPGYDSPTPALIHSMAIDKKSRGIIGDARANRRS